MHLFQTLLPLYTEGNRRIARAAFTKVKDELTRRYGGVTAYMRAPAEGQWVTKGRTDRDQIITLEVMTRKCDLRWWRQCRKISKLALSRNTSSCGTTCANCCKVLGASSPACSTLSARAGIPLAIS